MYGTSEIAQADAVGILDIANELLRFKEHLGKQFDRFLQILSDCVVGIVELKALGHAVDVGALLALLENTVVPNVV